MARANNTTLKKDHVVRASSASKKDHAVHADNAVLKKDHVVRVGASDPVLPEAGKPVVRGARRRANKPTVFTKVDLLLMEARKRLLASE